MGLALIILIAVMYALIRAKHDSYISNGKWKVWAFVEGVFLAILATLAHWMAVDTSWWQIVSIPLVFGFSFWITFDFACGWLRARNIFYFGTTGWDLRARSIFKSPAKYFVFKLIWLIIVSGMYIGG